jgi:hypothetical protein
METRPLGDSGLIRDERAFALPTGAPWLARRFGNRFRTDANHERECSERIETTAEEYARAGTGTVPRIHLAAASQLDRQLPELAT